jgi:hypothetical protein
VTPKSVVERLEASIGRAGAPRRLRSAIVGVLTDHFGVPEISASERAESLEPTVARIISSRAAECERAGTTARIAIIGASSDIVAGFCYVLEGDPVVVSKVKRQRVYAEEVLSAIRDMSFQQFETFGARVLDEMGAAFSKVTPQKGDQGIDFYGRFSLGQLHDLPLPYIKLAHDVEILFAGQAKHYPHRAVGPETVRELVGAVSLARTRSFSRPDLDPFDGLNLRPFSPVVTMLFTTGPVSSGALALGQSAGVIVRSGDQLAAFLADKGVGMVMTDSQLQFQKDSFEDWLRSNPLHGQKPSSNIPSRRA